MENDKWKIASPERVTQAEKPSLLIFSIFHCPFSICHLRYMHSELPLLRDLLVLLLSSIPIAFLCHRLRLPVLVGFMITGIVIGPYGLRLIHDVTAVEYLAEIGVVLLLFVLGI